MNQIALILFKDSKISNWKLGPVWNAPAEPRALAQFMAERLADTQPQAWLFWDSGLGDPDSQKVQSILNQPDDVWHVGLSLGTGGQPGIVDFIQPNWMFNCDPEQAAASWRISFRACLVRDDVLRQMQFIQPDFESLEAAALEWGHRCIQSGVFCRYEPQLIDQELNLNTSVHLTPKDELRFAEYRFGRRWQMWALIRAVLSGYWRLTQAWESVRGLRLNSIQSIKQTIYKRPLSKIVSSKHIQKTVSVIIPTLERYPYLKTILSQLRQQTIPPTEIIVIDQTPSQQRQKNLYDEFSDLPLRLIFQDQPGQCTSRNAGLQASHGEYILFIDDDDEIDSDLIERHLAHIETEHADASCGVANEVGAGELPDAFKIHRVADVFPTNNSLLRREALINSGLFDLAFEHGARADADLGMRLYLSGARSILNPDIAVLHHHAPRGGLRAHKARLITYAGSRQSFFQRSLPSATEIYLSKRYFTPRQTREMFWINIFASFSLHHPSWARHLFKVIISFMLLPDTWLQLRRAKKQAQELASAYPLIPNLIQQTQIIQE